MKWIASAAVASVLICQSVPASAETRAAAPPLSQIKIVYEVPTNRILLPVYERLKQRFVLEELREFLSVLRLPRELTLRTAQCGGMVAEYVANGPATICYEQIADVERIAASHTQDASTRQIVVTGAFVQAALHETARAIFDILEVPVWGREDDAADKLAALIMMQFGDEIAKMTIIGTGQLLLWSDSQWTGTKYASTASPEYQRFYNFACIALGANWWEFHGWMDNGRLPASRTGPNGAWCDAEYAQIKKAFNLRIMPYVDPDRLVAMRSKPWLNWTPPK